MVPGAVPSLPWYVVDAAGRETEPVSSYLRDRMLGDASPATCRSYGYDLLWWFRVLWALDVGWEQVTEAEAVALVGWLRHASNRSVDGGRAVTGPGPGTRRRASRPCGPATRPRRSPTI
ncbi:hypothetical protein ACU686_42970 [Yinghuangia aomiensis]